MLVWISFALLPCSRIKGRPKFKYSQKPESRAKKFVAAREERTKRPIEKTPDFKKTEYKKKEYVKPENKKPEYEKKQWPVDGQERRWACLLAAAQAREQACS